MGDDEDRERYLAAARKAERRLHRKVGSHQITEDDQETPRNRPAVLIRRLLDSTRSSAVRN